MSESDEIQDAVERERNEKDAKLGRQMRLRGESSSLPEVRQPREIVPLSIEVKSLVVAPMPRTSLRVGDVASLDRVVKTNDGRIRAFIWNEERISVDIDDPNKEIVFAPELRPTAEMFFLRQNKREKIGFGEEGDRIWEGDYEPIKFGKRNFLKFIKLHMAQFPTEIADSLKNLRMSEIETSEERLLDDESENEERVERMVQTTNVPTHFSAMFPISEGFEAELAFETKVYKEREYGGKGKVVVEVRCINARQVLRSMMEGILTQLPPDVPRYYGRLDVEGGGK